MLPNIIAANAEPDRLSPAPSWMTGASAFGNSASNWGTSGPWGADSVPWGVEGDIWTTTNGRGAPGLVDSEALIAVELCLVKGDGDSEDLRIANILFNNLDVIGEVPLT